MVIKPLLCSIALFVTPLAHADFYLGGLLNYGTASTKVQQTITEGETTGIVDKQYDASVISLIGQGGFFFSDFSALEMRYGIGLTDSDGIEVDNLIGAYGKFNYPVSHQVSLYGLAGYTQSKLNVKDYGTVKEAGFSAGAGFHYAFNSRWAMTAEYMSYVRNKNSTLDGFSLAMQYKF